MIAPHWGIRGRHCEYVAIVDTLNNYLALNENQQKEANETYRRDTTDRERQKHKKNFKLMFTNCKKLLLIRNRSNGRDLAAEVEFDTDGIDTVIDDEEEEEDVIVPHVGLASTQNDLDSLQANRTDRRNSDSTRRKKPRLSDESKKIKDLARVVHEKSFYSAARAVASANDATYLDPITFPSAPIRTTVLISINQIKDTSKAGGNTANQSRRTKTKISIVANSIMSFRDVMRITTDAVGRTSASHPDNYEVRNFFREEGKNLKTVVKDHNEKFSKERENPKRKRRSRESILGDITNTTSVATLI